MVKRGPGLSRTKGGVSRRAFLKTGGLIGLASAGALRVNVARAQSRTLKIGFIGAQSGVRANFGETTPWMIERIRGVVKDGLKVGGKSYAVELVIKDNQSDPNRSSVVGSELVLREKCDLVVCFDSDAALAIGELSDARGMPTISTMVPWTGWKFSRGASPEDLVEKSFPYTFHFFWGAGEVVKNFLAMWNSVKTNKLVGTFYSDTPTGKAFGNPKTGLPGGMAQHGYREVPGGFYKMATDDFTNQVTAFKNGGADIVSGLVLPSHWATFWNQAAQAGYKPQGCTVAGPVRFKDTPVKNVALTSMAGGQWRKTKNGRFPFELLIVYNATAPQIPVETELKLLSQLG